MNATRRLAAIISVLALLAMPGPSLLAAAQAGTPAVAPTTVPLDLATMMLVPSDVKRPHAMLWSGGRYFLDSYSHQKAGLLQAAGDQGGFEVWLGPPTSDRDYLVGASLDEFTSVKGATAGYAALQGSGVEPVQGVKTVGDASALTRWTGTDPYDASRPDYGLTLVFRIDRLVGTVFVDDYTGAKPHAAEAVALGEAMAARITKVLAGKPTQPGFSNRAVRFTVSMAASFQDGYYRLNGRDRIGWEGGLPAGQPTFAESYRGATTVFLVGQYASTETGAPWERVRLVQFPSSTAAASWVTGFLSIAEQGPSGWQQVKPVAGAKQFGDQSQTVTFQTAAAPGAPGKTGYGAAIIARYGALAVSVRIEAYRPVPVALVQSLMATQQQCLRTTGNCPRVTPSPALLQLTVASANRSAPGHLTAMPVAMTSVRRWPGAVAA